MKRTFSNYRFRFRCILRFLPCGKRIIHIPGNIAVCNIFDLAVLIGRRTADLFEQSVKFFIRVRIRQQLCPFGKSRSHKLVPCRCSNDHLRRNCRKLFQSLLTGAVDQSVGNHNKADILHLFQLLYGFPYHPAAALIDKCVIDGKAPLHI